MHKTLSRQVDHHISSKDFISSGLKELLNAISTTYDDYDHDRVLIERSLDISSHELKGLISLLQATLDSTNDGILVVDIVGKIMNYNRKLLEVLEVNAESVATHDYTLLINAVADKTLSPEVFLKKTESASTHINDEYHDIVTFKDGRIVERYSKPQLLEGKNIGRVWSFSDITQRVTAENELKNKIGALEHLNKSMIDRELKMIELKKRISQLEATKA